DEAVAGTCGIIMFCRVLLRVGHPDLAIDVADAEWREVHRNFWIAERTVEFGRSKVAVEDVDPALTEIGREQEIPGGVGPKSQTFIDRSVQRRIWGWRDVEVVDDPDRLIPAIPGADRALLAVENEDRRRAVAAIARRDEETLIRMCFIGIPDNARGGGLRAGRLVSRRRNRHDEGL